MVVVMNVTSLWLPVIGMLDTAYTAFLQTVNNIVEVLDTIQVWPEEVVEDMGSE